MEVFSLENEQCLSTLVELKTLLRALLCFGCFSFSFFFLLKSLQEPGALLGSVLCSRVPCPRDTGSVLECSSGGMETGAKLRPLLWVLPARGRPSDTASQRPARP